VRGVTTQRWPDHTYRCLRLAPNFAYLELTLKKSSPTELPKGETDEAGDAVRRYLSKRVNGEMSDGVSFNKFLSCSGGWGLGVGNWGLGIGGWGVGGYMSSPSESAIGEVIITGS
jgi:hypothetical protein